MSRATSTQLGTGLFIAMSLCVAINAPARTAVPSNEADPDRPIDLPGERVVFTGGSMSVSTLRTPDTYSLVIHSKNAGQRLLPLTYTPWGLKAIHPPWSGRMVVEQMRSSNAEEVYVIDTNGRVGLADRFLAFSPSLSPDGRHLVFLAWFPEHFSDEDTTSDFVMRYDLQNDRAGNRHAPRHDFPDAEDPERGVGYQVFPQSRPITEVTDGPQRRPYHSVLSDITWSPDSLKFVFLDQQYPTSRFLGHGEARGRVRPAAHVPDRAGLTVVIGSAGSQASVSTYYLPGCDAPSGTTCDIVMRNATFTKDGLRFDLLGSGASATKRTMEIPFNEFTKQE